MLIPSSDKEIIFEVHSRADKEGKYQFSMYWLTNYIPGHPKGEYFVKEVPGVTGKTGFVRVQAFLADPTSHVQRLKESGHTIKVIRNLDA